MRRFNKNFEKIVENNPVVPYIRMEVQVQGDVDMRDKVEQSNFKVGDIGAGARVAIGKNISWTEGLATLPDGAALMRQFDELFEKIDDDASLDEDGRELARQKAAAVVEGVKTVETSPATLRRALRDAKSWFGGASSNIGAALAGILKGEAAQKTLGTVTEAATKAAIEAFIDQV
jgi:hypothetical protein